MNRSSIFSTLFFISLFTPGILFADSTIMPPTTISGTPLTLKQNLYQGNTEKSLFELAQYQYLLRQYGAAYDSFYKFSKRYRDSSRLPEAYYWMALCRYSKGSFAGTVKYANYFVENFPNSPLMDRILSLLGDACFATGDFKRARLNYHDVIVLYPRSGLLSHVYYQFSRADRRLGLSEEAHEFESFILKHFEDSYEAGLLGISRKTIPVDAISLPSPKISKQYYTIQVIALTDALKSENMIKRLKSSGFDAYLSTGKRNDQVFYRVRIGKFNDKDTGLKWIKEVKEKTGLEGYLTLWK